jgi:predicted GNAT family N-acyltransferase
MSGSKKAATQPTLLLHLKLDDMKENIIEVKKPSKCSEKELEDFECFVLAGGQVNLNTLNSLISKAKALVFLKQGGCLKGIAAIKNPNLTYKNKVFEKAKATVLASDFMFELGWIFVLPSERGKKFSRELVKAALTAADSQSLFATSHLSNEKMHHTLKEYGFSCHGQEYSNSNGSKNVLFIRP